MIEKRKYALMRAVVAVAMTSCATPVLSADGTWIGTTGGSWSDPSNWAGGVIPGAVGAPYTNTDTANFVNLAGTNGADPIDLLLVDIDPNRNIGNMFADNLNSISVQIGTDVGQSLRLTSGGTISTGTNFTNTNTSAGNINFTIAAPLIIEGNTYNFISNAPAGRQGGIQLTGPISFTGAGAKTLVFGGTNADTGSGNQSQNQITGLITDSAGGSVGIVKNGSGTWELNNQIGFN
ncbi:MAG TPA: hypothetical protein PKB10_13610, partial [Tepidisphaeraceae bacterium]|nr:hypothetical protein [Tepidisphaeraceae bacterium]